MGYVMQGSTERRNVKIILRYMVKPPGEKYKVWKTEELDTPLLTFAEVGKLAHEAAVELDTVHGDDHFWTVTVRNLEGHDYYQLFHGRLE